MEPRRSRLLRAQLERLAATKGLSAPVSFLGLRVEERLDGKLAVVWHRWQALMHSCPLARHIAASQPAAIGSCTPPLPPHVQVKDLVEAALEEDSDDE